MESFGQLIGWVVVTIVAVMASMGSYGIIMLAGGKIDKESGLVVIFTVALWWISFETSPFALVLNK
jgi:hypothetical protein